jgi:hypothetical protein
MSINRPDEGEFGKRTDPQTAAVRIGAGVEGPAYREGPAERYGRRQSQPIMEEEATLRQPSGSRGPDIGDEVDLWV